MPNVLDLVEVFRLDAEGLRRARQKAMQVHPTDIKAAGNQVEEAVRQYLSRMLQRRYHVTSGHLIDSRGHTSPQIDIIISDNFGLSSLLTTNDGTEYVPIESVHAIGEVKSTFHRSKGYYQKMHDDLEKVSLLDRPIVENTAYEGIADNTLLEHMIRASKNRYLNNLFSFLLCVDSGDFDFEDLKPVLRSSDPKLLPSMCVLLDRGVIAYAKKDGAQGFTYSKYPNEVSSEDFDWCFFSASPPPGGSLQGCHLAMLYGSLIDHIVSSDLGPPNVYKYTAQMSCGSRSSLLWANDGAGKTGSFPTPQAE